MPIRSPLEDVEIPALTLFDFLFGDSTAVHGSEGTDQPEADKPALIDGQTGASTSYRQLKEHIELVAGALASRGVELGDVVALHCPNTPAFGAVFHGILRAGAVATTVNSLATGEDLAKQLSDSGAKMLFTVSALYPAAQEAATLVEMDDRAVIVIDGPGSGGPDAQHQNLAELLAENAPAPQVSFDPATHLAVLPYSSGTTGRPKGVMLTHRNLVANVCQIEPVLQIRREDTLLAVLPFFHIYGMTVLLNAALRARATLVTMPRFDLAEFLGNTAAYRCSYLFIAPPIAVALAKHPMVDNYDLSCVDTVFSGAAPLDGALGAQVVERLGCEIGQGYGMSEMSPVSHSHIRGVDTPLGSAGITLPNMVCKIVDPATGEEIDYSVPSGGVASFAPEQGSDSLAPEQGSEEELSAPGELWCSGPNVMRGYLGNEAGTRDCLDADGFLHTGDIVRMDSAGHIYVVDRLKELIKYKGYQVPPAELEALLLTHPGIADAAVIGVTDDEGEEIPKAFVVQQDGANLSPDEVMTFVAERVAPYKKVRRVEFIGLVPKSASGKILRRELRIGQAGNPASGSAAAANPTDRQAGNSATENSTDG